MEEKTIEQLEKELFDMVYQWGKVGIKVNERSESYQKLLEEIKFIAIYDNRRHGTT